MRKVTIISLVVVLSFLVMVVPASAEPPVPASGGFSAIVDFSTLTLTPVGNNKCILEVEGKLVFTGTLVGEAPGKTRALVFAACPNVLNNPPGTFPDVFESELAFTGTVNGIPATANIATKAKPKLGVI